MIKSSRKVYPVYFFIDILIIGICLYVPYILRYNQLKDIFSNLKLPFFREYSFIFILWALFILISLKRRNLYSTDRTLTIPRETIRVIISIFSSSLLIGSIIFFSQYKFFSRAIFIKSFLSLCLFLSGWRIIKRLILRKLISEGLHNFNVLIIGAGRVGKLVLEEIKNYPYYGLRVIGFLDDRREGFIEEIPIIGKLEDIGWVVKKYFVDELIITIPSERNIVGKLIDEAKKYRLGIRIVPDNFEEPLQVLDIGHLGILPLLTYKERFRHPAEFLLKNILDFLLSFILIVILSPFFLVIAILIKLDSPGEVFYVQKRVGKKGRLFSLYKFRSMVKDADLLKPSLISKNEVKDGVIFKIKNDPRITRVGKFLRRYSLDELPQLFNVLFGDMSLVGPRPPTPDEVAKYNHIHMERLSIRPGITCLPQIRGRSELTFKKWVRWDIWYINNWSFGLDLWILWKTIPVVLKGKGAY